MFRRTSIGVHCQAGKGAGSVITEPRLMVKCKVCGVPFFSGIGLPPLKDKGTIIVDDTLICPKGHEAKYSGADYIEEVFSAEDTSTFPVGCRW